MTVITYIYRVWFCPELDWAVFRVVALLAWVVVGCGTVLASVTRTNPKTIGPDILKPKPCIFNPESK